MNEIYDETILKLESKIQGLKMQSDIVVKIEEVIVLIINSLAKLKSQVLRNGFKNTKEEISFFKYQKPILVSKLIYYNVIYKIDTSKSMGNRLKGKYLKYELRKLKRYFDYNLDFYKYYRSNSTYLDEKYFLRGKYDIKLGIDTHYLVSDPAFSTSHDYKVARIMANDLLQIYLESQLRQNDQINTSNNFTLSWTDSKTALTELIYALHTHGVFNHGNADINLIAKAFENTFNIDLGDFYHTFMELRSRKINRTKFLDSLRDALTKKMDELG